jgi:hypothetical protein
MTGERIEAFWQDATADDVAGIANTRKPILARVRDEETEAWREDLISGWKLSRLLPGARWIDADGVHWKQCQVYREPSWHANKPDPGPGFRLLGKFPDEELKPGDQAWNLWDDKQWSESDNANGGGHQVFGVWYRRRIEPLEPEPKHYVLRVGDTFETPCGHKIKAVSPGVEQIEFKLRAGFKAKLPNGQTITITKKGFEVTQ